MSHHRLHYIYPLEGKPEVRITMAFAARRPDLTFAADVVDVHVYLVSRWVLDFIAESAGIADMTVRKDIIPLLARSQHTIANTSEKSFVTPSEKLHTSIPLHWTGEGADLSVQSLNAACGLLPRSTSRDHFRQVFPVAAGRADDAGGRGRAVWTRRPPRRTCGQQAVALPRRTRACRPTPG